MFEVSYFSIEKAVEKKTDLEMNALSTQHTKPKAAYAQHCGAIQRTKLALPECVLQVLSVFWTATVLFTQAW